MATERQIDANRANAQLSTGPVTPEGKARAAGNALKHGLSAKTLLLANESRERFDSLLDSLIEHHRPANSEELACVEELAAARWRQRRIWAISAALLDGEMDRQSHADPERLRGCDEITRASLAFRELTDNSRTLRECERQQSSAARQFDRVLARLRSLRAARGESSGIEKCTNEPNSSTARQVPLEATPLAESASCSE